MTTPVTIDEVLAATAAAVDAQQTARAATLNAATIARLSAGTSGPAVPPAVTGDSDAVQGASGG